MEKEELKYWLALNNVKGVGAVRFKQLVDHFDEIHRAWETSAKTLREIGWDQRSINLFMEDRKRVDLKEELSRFIKSGARVLTIKDKDYPENLKNIYDPPPLIFYKGTLEKGDKNSLAVVGSRRMTRYGKGVVDSLVQTLAASGLTIVSGLVFGVDGASHKAALSVGQRTIAVLGTGIDQIYPFGHKELAEQIVRCGALISELPLGFGPMPYHFPMRNRIISGMTLGTLVIEAGEKSGTLITAFSALEQGREVFAVPGSIFSQMSKGTIKLLNKGAKAVTCAKDILEELNMPWAVSREKSEEIIPENENEEAILKVLDNEPLHIDVIVRESGLPASVASSTLTMMEVVGKVRNIGGMRYVKGR